MHVWQRCWLVVGLLLLSACGRIGFANVTAGNGADGGTDAGPDDAAVGDAGEDSGGSDAGFSDAGVADAGTDAGGTVMITVTLPSGGRVLSDPPGIDCPGTCQLPWPVDVPIELAAIEGADNVVFSQWAGDCAGAELTCELTPTGDVSATATFDTANYAFITGSQPNAAFGSIAAADALCQAEADAESLGGTYRAWLSDSSVDAVDRFPSSRGWVRVDGARVADSVADIGAGLIRVPTHLQADGTSVEGVSPFAVATGSNRDSRSTGNHCNNYSDVGGTISAGNSLSVGLRWVLQANVGCGQATRLYCFGTDHNTALPIRSVAARRTVFITEDPWTTPGAGLPSADAFCMTQASEAALPGTFVAFLSTDSTSAAGRVVDGPNFARTDGVLLAATTLDFLAGNSRTSPVLNQFGNQGSTNLGPLTGASSHGSSTFRFGNCDNWTNSGGSVDLGNQFRAFSFFDAAAGTACTVATRPIYCIQQ